MQKRCNKYMDASRNEYEWYNLLNRYHRRYQYQDTASNEHGCNAGTQIKCRIKQYQETADSNEYEQNTASHRECILNQDKGTASN